MAAKTTREEQYEDENVQQEEVPVEDVPQEPKDWTDRVVQATPWWAISFACHLAFLLIATLIVMEAGAFQQKEEITMMKLPEKPLEQPKFELPRDIFDNRKPIKQDKAVEDPVFIKDAEESDHNETANNEEFQQAKGDSKDFLSDKPFKGPGVNDSIGVGGGGGGRYGGRLGGKRNLVSRGGGSQATEGAVLAGLRWLARHQGSDGHWDTDGFTAECGKIIKGSCGGPGYPEFDTGNTGLALLAFLGAGYTHLSRDTYDGICFGHVVKKAIQWLQQNQDAEGCVGGKSGSKYMYNHSIASLALCEAYGLTGSGLFKDNAQNSINFLIAAQNPYKGWRYQSKSGDNDTSVTGWCVMALKSAEISGLNTPRGGYEGTKAWFDEVTGEDFRAGYTAKGTGQVVVQGKNEQFSNHEALTAIAIMGRIFIDKNRGDPKLKGGAELLVRDLPVWDGSKIDFYYWYYASLALFQYDGPSGPYWKAWNENMKNSLVNNQKKTSEGCLSGSWDPIDRWGFEGGRVYATAINVLTLEVYYRYENVFGSRGK